MIMTMTMTILLCFLSLFFTFSTARIPFEIHIDRTNPNSLSVSQNNNPSGPIDKPATLIRWEPEPKPETVQSTDEPSNRIPFTVFTFNPRIPRHPLPLSSRLRHRCHHYKPWKPRPRAAQISNTGGDMDNHLMPRGRVRHVARGWTRFGNVEPMFSHQRAMSKERSELLKRFYHRYQREPEMKDTGLVKRIRKFLNQF